MRLRKRHFPTGIVHSHRTVIEIDCRLVRFQVSHMTFERMKIQSLDKPGILRNVTRRTGMRFVARTMAGAQNSEAAAPMKMLLRVMRP
jgi:hypothetical protein